MKKSVLTREGLSQLWESITTLFVRKETGKGLSSNDFTNTYKNKVDDVDSALKTLSSEMEAHLDVFNTTVGTKISDYGTSNVQYSYPDLKNGLVMFGAGTDLNLCDALIRSTNTITEAIMELDARLKALEEKS